MGTARILSYRGLILSSVMQAISVLSAGPSIAGPISNDSDVLGVKLSMNRDQAKKVIADAFPGPSIEEIPVQLGTPEYKKSAVAGFVGEASGGDFGVERVVVLYNPNDSTTDIFSMTRYKEFPKSSIPVGSVIASSLTEKYGQPTRVKTTSLDQYLTWAAPGVLEHTDGKITSCDKVVGDFFYENADRRYLGATFVSIMNLFSNGAPMREYAKCGAMLQVQLRLADDKAHVVWMKERLIDLAKGTSELAKFSDDFWAKANAEKQAKISKDSQNKPKL